MSWSSFSAQLAGADGIARGEELDDLGGDIHAAGGVDARADAEADVSGGERTTRGVELRYVEERTQAGIHGTAQAVDAEARDDAVLAQQRHGIGDGGDHQHLEEGRQQLLAGALRVYCFEQRLGQLECHARAAEVLAGIGAVGLVGIEDGECASAGPSPLPAGDGQ